MHGRHAHDVDLITKVLDLLSWLSLRRLAHHLDRQDDVSVLEALIHEVIVVASLHVISVCSYKFELRMRLFVLIVVKRGSSLVDLNHCGS
jgi:hypothetical protein